MQSTAWKFRFSHLTKQIAGANESQSITVG